MGDVRLQRPPTVGWNENSRNLHGRAQIPLAVEGGFCDVLDGQPPVPTEIIRPSVTEDQNLWKYPVVLCH